MFEFDEDLKNGTTYRLWVVMGAVIILQFLAFSHPHRLPHPDLFYVMHVINYLYNPELFGSNWITNYLTHFHTQTAPFYYYGITYPIRQVLSAKSTLLVVGFVLTLISLYFSGYPWRKGRDALVAIFLLFVLITVGVPPLEGNKRSFTAFFLIAALALGDRPDYLKTLFLVALAAGIYPPMGLVLLVYLGFYRLEELRLSTSSFLASVKRLSGACLVFLAVMTPYWSNVLLGESEQYVTNFVDRMEYSVTSVTGLVKTFLLGSRGTHYGALFLVEKHLALFAILLTMVLIQWLILGEEFRFSRRCRRMLLTVMVLWGLAHLFFPLIYFPFKYTRLGLPLVLVFPAVRNLPSTAGRLRELFEDRPVSRMLLNCLALLTILFYLPYYLGLYKVGWESFVGLDIPNWWEFLVLLPIVMSCLLLFPDRDREETKRGLLVVLVVGGLVLMPHHEPLFFFRGAHISTFGGMFDLIEDSPPASMVAGPPQMMTTVPALAARPVYNIPDFRTSDVLCGRNEAYWSAAYASDPASVIEFMERNDISFFLVDRQALQKERVFATKGCLPRIDVASNKSNAYLNRHFPDAAWSSSDRRFYLITVEVLRDRTSASSD